METIICKYIACLLVLTLPIGQRNKTAKYNEKEKLIGVWGTDIDENANFGIGKDSIYYLDVDKSVKYLIKENPGGKTQLLFIMAGIFIEVFSGSEMIP